MDQNAWPWLKELFETLFQHRFYGKVGVSLQAGQVVSVKQEETIKPLK